jgi:predicted nucleic acid-binding Zn ribbon protein
MSADQDPSAGPSDLGGDREPRFDGAPPDQVAASGPDLARAALAAAKARARDKGLSPRTNPRRGSRPLPQREPGDVREPELFGAAIRRLMAERGWEATTASARVVGEWDRLVGPEVAEHCRPSSLVDGELVLVATSSAWATQLRLISRQLLATLHERVGPDVVTKLVIKGPVQVDWRRGPRVVRGRGPRDTYG